MVIERKIYKKNPTEHPKREVFFNVFFTSEFIETKHNIRFIRVHNKP